jgi:hypothetical protein
LRVFLMSSNTARTAGGVVEYEAECVDIDYFPKAHSL